MRNATLKSLPQSRAGEDMDARLQPDSTLLLMPGKAGRQ
jgi:hypothetical protein